MITNSEITVYHKGFDRETRLETWTRFNYQNVWYFGGKGAGIDKGFENANDVQVRISYNLNENLDIENFKIGDVLVKGFLDIDINTIQDLNNYDTYTILSIKDNNFGTEPHIHIGGK